MDLGEIIRNERKKKHLTQKELAELIGTTQPALSAYENNTMVPMYGTLALIADALDLNLISLLDPEWGKNHVILSTDQEIEIHKILVELNTEGQNKVLEYASDIKENSKYRKE